MSIVSTAESAFTPSSESCQARMAIAIRFILLFHLNTREETHVNRSTRKKSVPGVLNLGVLIRGSYSLSKLMSSATKAIDHK